MSQRVVFECKDVGLSYRQRIGLLRYRSFWALSDVSFTLRAGETLGIIGNNGAGKSTLLRLIAGIVEQDKGQVVRQKGLRYSLLALSAGFRPELPGRENAILGGMLLGMSYRDAMAALPAIESFAELGAFFDQPVASYSTGMRARLGFAVAIHANADVLLIDEVLGVGDQEFKMKSSMAMRDKIKSEKTVVLVSHSLESIAELCDRVLWIEKGKVIAIGEAEKVIGMYHNAVREAVKQMFAKEREAAKKQAATA